MCSSGAQSGPPEDKVNLFLGSKRGAMAPPSLSATGCLPRGALQPQRTIGRALPRQHAQGLPSATTGHVTASGAGAEVIVGGTVDHVTVGGDAAQVSGSTSGQSTATRGGGGWGSERAG